MCSSYWNNELVETLCIATNTKSNNQILETDPRSPESMDRTGPDQTRIKIRRYDSSLLKPDDYPITDSTPDLDGSADPSTFGTFTMAPGAQRNACLSCRQRKLKCDRKQPCANCIARSVECTEQDLPPNRALKRPLPHESESSTLSSILSRLDQIEEYLAPSKRVKHVSISTPIGDQLNAIRFDAPSVSQSQETASNDVAELMPPEDQMQATKYSVNDSFLVGLIIISLHDALY